MPRCASGMRLEISELHKRLDTTMIYVTHDQVEAMTMADKIVVLRAGNIEQVGSPLELYRNRATRSWPASSARPENEPLDGAAKPKSMARHTIGIRPEHIADVSTEGTWQGRSVSPSIWALTRSSMSTEPGLPR
jgi:multiple sugar transport system ATP-binding protein